MTGSARAVRDDPKVIEAYLGAPRVSALRIEALEAGYEPGLPIVHGASLVVEANEIVAVLGPNGAGKSTLIKAVAGLVPVFRGRSSCTTATSRGARPTACPTRASASCRRPRTCS